MRQPAMLRLLLTGALLIYEWTRNWIKVVRLTAAGKLAGIEPFAPQFAFRKPMDIKFAPDHTMFVLEYGDKWHGNTDGQLQRLSCRRGNRPPVIPPPPPAAPEDITKPWPSPDVVQGIKMPAPRSKKEIEPVLAAVQPMTDEEKQRPFHIVLCAAEKDPGHNGVGFHDYPVWRERWTKILAGVPAVTTEPADNWPTEEQFKKADVIALFHHNPAWTASKAPELDLFDLRRVLAAEGVPQSVLELRTDFHPRKDPLEVEVIRRLYSRA